jgi:hypothetical protein
LEQLITQKYTVEFIVAEERETRCCSSVATMFGVMGETVPCPCRIGLQDADHRIPNILENTGGLANDKSTPPDTDIIMSVSAGALYTAVRSAYTAVAHAESELSTYKSAAIGLVYIQGCMTRPEYRRWVNGSSVLWVTWAIYGSRCVIDPSSTLE